MKKALFMLVAAFLLLSTAAIAADIDGKWVASMPGRDGNTMQQTFTLKADGDKLTGSVSGRMGDTQISEGTVKGSDVSFLVVREFNGNTMKMRYTGTVAGDELKMKMTMEGSDRPPREFTAKREK